MGSWLNTLPSEVAYGLATTLVLAAGGWIVSRFRRDDARDGGVSVAATSLPPAPIPRMLPRAPQRFVDRDSQLAQLDRLRERAAEAPTPLVAVVTGMHGVGKSAIGSRWARLNYERFPDGTLSADFSRRRNPHGVEVGDVLADFLRELGVADVAMPISLRDKQRLFGRLTADRRLLVLLDDVDQPAQALTTLPAGAGSVVVVTSAFDMEELVRAGADRIELVPLDEASARDLLAEMAGPARVYGEDNATREVIKACGGLPIALCVCGARLATRPDKTIAWLAEQLASGPARLRTLSPPGEFDVSGIFDVAYDALGDDAAALYRRLGLHPGPDFTTSAAAALAGVTLHVASNLLERLEEAYLVQSDGKDRRRPHDLVRDHMRACASDDETAEERDAAVRRAVDWYTAAARGADHAVVDDRLRLAGRKAPTASDLPRLASPREAFAWFARERRNVIAAQRAALEREWYEPVWQIAEALWPLCASHKRFTEWIESHEAAIEAGERTGNRAVLARMHSQLARAHAELGEHTRAATEMDHALQAARAADRPQLLASVIEFSGVCALRAGRYPEALESFREARAGFEACRLERGVALQDYHVGWCLVLAGDDALALEPLERSRITMARLGDEINVGRSLVRRGEALRHLGRGRDARRALTSAIEVLDRAGVGFEQAEAYETLAVLADDVHDVDGARVHRQRAYRLYRELGHPRADALLTLLERCEA